MGQTILERHFSAILGILLVTCLVEYVPTASADGHCVWYGVCSTGYKHKNCFYNGTAKPIAQDSIEILEELCPDIVAGGKSCCDTEQVRYMNTSASILRQIFESCPSCINNYFKHICALTCSPRQSDFVRPVTVEVFNSTHNQIKEVDYHLSMDYMEATFNSCSEVIVLIYEDIGYAKAMTLACGSDTCTPTEWFKFMGNEPDNPYVPFQINFKSTPLDGQPPLNPPTKGCNISSNECERCHPHVHIEPFKEESEEE